jgi:plasmid stability protein
MAEIRIRNVSEEMAEQYRRIAENKNKTIAAEGRTMLRKWIDSQEERYKKPIVRLDQDL